MTTTELHEDRIAEAAFYIWQAEGKPQGKSQEHWFRAVEELKTDNAPAPKKAARKAPAKKAAGKVSEKSKASASKAKAAE